MGRHYKNLGYTQYKNVHTEENYTELMIKTCLNCGWDVQTSRISAEYH